MSDGSDETRRPAFLITVDTEGDNLWSQPRTVTTRNARYLPRFQELCERYGLKPTYLTNWEMANCPAFQEFGKDIVRRRTGEIGMHLHAWNSPPLVPLTSDDDHHQPFLIEYPEGQIREKVKVMTGALQAIFGIKVVSHRAGRWSFNELYARILVDYGYQVDCSVTPHVSWKATKGDPKGTGGTDFSQFPETAYFVDLANICQPGLSALLELPVTVIPLRHPGWVEKGRAILQRGRFGAKVARRLWPPCLWLRPNGRNRARLLSILNAARRDGRDYVEFMLHSSELMPGGSPTFASPRSIEALYDDLEALFASASDFEGHRLCDYHRRWSAMYAAARDWKWPRIESRPPGCSPGNRR